MRDPRERGKRRGHALRERKKTIRFRGTKGEGVV